MNRYFPALFFSIALATTPLAGLAQSTTTVRPVTSQSINITIAALEFLDLMAQGNFSAALEKYSPDIREDLTPQNLEQEWQDIVTAHGKLQKQVSTNTRQVNQSGDSGVVVITCEFEQGVQELLIEFDDNNQVLNFNIFGE